MTLYILLAALTVAVIILGIFLAVSLSRFRAREVSARSEIDRYEESTRRLLEETRRQYESHIASLEDRLDRRQADAEIRMADRDKEIRRQARLEFASLASDVLAREKASLSDINRENIDAILSPLRERISDFQQTVSDNHTRDNASRAAIIRQMEALARSNSEIGMEARRLSNALRGDSRLQGQWGESVLRSLLESAGLTEGINFTMQTTSVDGKTLREESGAALRPDCVISLPGGHRLAVDAKTSLTDYLRYVEASDDAAAAEALRRHILSVRKHVKELADKQYHRLIPSAMEHTLMFMPNEGAFIAAMRGDAALGEYAAKLNVVIVSPAHLISIVQLVGQLWRTERQNRNAEAIAETAGRLYDRFVQFINEFEKIERNLRLSLKSYDDCRHLMITGNQSLTARAERLRKMGAKVSRRIPESLSAEAGSEEE